MSGQTDQTKRSGPLGGIKVLDLSSIIAGPYGCTLLGDLGAEVIKVEAPSGDPIRQYPSTLTGESRAYIGINRNKSGLVLDLKQPDGLRVFDSLVAGADVLVHNFRPSVPPRLGIDYARMATVNPRLIYCSVSGFGSSGPMRDRAGYDQLLQAMTGICAAQGPASDKPEIVWGSVVDYYTSSLVAFSVSSALFERERTGRGGEINVSLLQAALSMQSARLVWSADEGREVNRDFRSLGTTALYPTADGFLYLTTPADHFWRAFCDIAGLPEFGKDSRYDTTPKRAARSAELVPVIRQALMAHTALQWEEIFGERVPCAAVRDIEDIFDHPQVAAEDLIALFDHPVVGTYRGLKRPVTFSDYEPAGTPAPRLGEHSRDILSGLGFSSDDINGFVQRGIVRTAEG